MGHVDSSQVAPLYANTTPGLTADANVFDPAIAALIVAINENFDSFEAFKASFELPIPDQSIVTRHLRNLAVTNPKLAPLAVTADKIADGTITTANLADLVITAAKIANATITEPKLSDFSVSRRTIQNGAVGASQIDPNILNAISDATILVKFGIIDEQLKNIHLDVKLKYGALGDNSFHTISSVFPLVTLAQVQALNPLATLSNSADWYALQLAVNNEYNMYIPKGIYIIDLPLLVSSRVNIYGENYENYTGSVIKNIGTGHCFSISEYSTFTNIITIGNSTSGSGMFIANGCRINNVQNNGHGRYGIEFSNVTHVISCYVEKSTNDYNKLGGIFIRSTGISQKNNIAFHKVYCVKNGTDADNLNSNATTTSGHGIYIDGGLGISVVDSVCEYNTGAGLFLDMTTVQNMRGFTGDNIYFEQNKYTQILVDTRIGVWRNINISGSIYNSVQAYPSNSLQTGPEIGNVVIYGNYGLIPGFNIDDIYSTSSSSLNMLSFRQSLKMFGDFETTNDIYSTLVTKTDSNGEGYSCLKLDISNPVFQEIEPYYTPVNPNRNYKVTVECKYNKVSSTKIIFSLQALDKDKNYIYSGVVQPIVWVTTNSGGVFQTDILDITPAMMGGITRYLRLNVIIDGTVSANDWVLIKSVHVDKLDNMLVPVPASKTSLGKTGTISADANYFYICHASNLWIRVPKDATW